VNRQTAVYTKFVIKNMEIPTKGHADLKIIMKNNIKNKCYVVQMQALK